MLVLDNTAVSEARLLHPNNDGYFFVGKKSTSAAGVAKWFQAGYHVSSLEQVLGAVKNTPDTYISQASFVARRRVVSATKSISCLFVDIDCYNQGLVADDATVQILLKNCDSYGIPRPSYIVSSGCGLYAKWILDRPLSDSHLHAWNSAQAILIHLFKSIGADPKARDAARVLRATTTINSKSGKIVDVGYFEGKSYNFTDLLQKLNSICLETQLALGQKRAKNLIKTYTEQELSNLEETSSEDLSHLLTYTDRVYMPLTMGGKLNITTLNWARFLDLRDLMIRRGGAKRGQRDLFIFWMTATLAGANIIRPDNIWSEVEQLLLSFPHSKDFNPLNDGSLSSLIGRIGEAAEGHKRVHGGKEHSPIYTPTNDTLLNLFQVSSDEEVQMRTIISTQEKRRRADTKVPGRAERREARQDARYIATSLRQQGMPVEKIAQQLNVNRATVYRMLKTPEQKANPAEISNQELQQRTIKHQAWLQSQKRQVELSKEREQNLQSAREAQKALAISLKIMRLVEKATQVSLGTCSQSRDGVSSVRKIPLPQNNADSASDHASESSS